MTACALLLLGQTRVLEGFRRERSWVYEPLQPSVSREWQQRKREGEALVRTHRSFSKERRQVEMLKLYQGVFRQSQMGKEAYFLSCLIASFPEDWKTHKYRQDLWGLHQYISGRADPEFARMAYLAFVALGQASGLRRIAPQLAERFPADMGIVRTFLEDAYYGSASVGDVNLALRLLPTVGFSELKTEGFRAMFLLRRSTHSKLRSDVRTAIAAHEQLLQRELTPMKKRHVEYDLRTLRSRLTDPKYKEG